MQYDFSFLNDEPTKRAFTADEVIFKEGETGEEMYYIISGEVEIAVAGKVMEVIQAEGIIGEMALIDNSPRSATATARTDATLAVIDQDRFTALLQQTPLFAIQVMRILARRLRRSDSRIAFLE